MNVERLDPKAIERVSGPSWEGLRDKFLAISRALLDVAPETDSELTTIYVKFRTKHGPPGKVFAVVWLKKSTELVVGLALPSDVTDDVLAAAPAGHKYPGLTAYLRLRPTDAVPDGVKAWAKAAYENVQQ
jgi:hypothetical protein